MVKVAPRLDEQLADEKGRHNIITYTPRTCCIPQTFTLDDLYRGDRAELTEYETLCQLDGFFAYVESLNGKYANEAKSMRENLTFIGEKEYKEAAAGIAASWEAALEANTDLQICVIAGEIKINKNQIKSDEYLLDNILANFTEEDWEEYGGRIIVDRDDIANMPKENLRVVLLDDWAISGSQLRDVYHSLVDQYPEIKDQIEIQLIVANEQRIKYGLSVDELMGDGKKIPVRAYFSAHDSKTAKNGAYITGFHSSVDYDFEKLIRRMLWHAEGREKKSEPRGEMYMPPGTNIVRPYSKDGYKLTNIERARQCRRRRLAERQGSGYVIL